MLAVPLQYYVYRALPRSLSMNLEVSPHSKVHDVHNMPYNILIVGAGAIGAFYGSRLAQDKNAEVSVVCRSNYNTVKEKGFNIESPYYGSYDWKPTNVYRKPAEAQGQKWDYLVVTTKSLPDVSDDSALLEGLVRDSTAIVLIQNGIGRHDVNGNHIYSHAA
jgi:2-dehydropantoate 2-reductase